MGRQEHVVSVNGPTYWHTIWEHPNEPEAPLGHRMGSVVSVPIYVRARVLWLLGLASFTLVVCLTVGGSFPTGLPLIGHASVRAFGVGGVLGGLAGLFLHETGHAVAAWVRRQSICHVILSTKAAVVIGRCGEPFTAKDIAIIVLAGPLINLAAAFLTALAAVEIHGSIGFGCAIASIINVMFLLDLIPGHGMGPHGHAVPNDGALLIQTLRSARCGLVSPLSP